MDGEKEVSSVRFGWWNSRGHDQVRACWTGTDVPNELVHNVLAHFDEPTGIASGWVDGRVAVSIDIRITFRDEEFPF